jgi:nitrogen PTS system EIIA component
MKLVEILKPEAVIAELRAMTKVDALNELASTLAAVHPEIDAARLVEVLLEREELGSTAIGEGIAIPHGKLAGVGNVVAAFARSKGGIDFDSLDGSPTRLFVLLVAPEDSAGLHLKALARVSRLLKEKSFRERLFAAGDRDDLWATIQAEDAKY